MTKETQTQAIAEPFKFKNAALLNRLSEMRKMQRGIDSFAVGKSGARLTASEPCCAPKHSTRPSTPQWQRTDMTITQQQALEALERVYADATHAAFTDRNLVRQYIEQSTAQPQAVVPAPGEVLTTIKTWIEANASYVDSGNKRGDKYAIWTDQFQSLADALENIAQMEYPSAHHDGKNLREVAALLRAAAGVDVAGLIERAAKAIYDQWADQNGWVEWVPGGNSMNQDEARRIARAALESSLRLVLAQRVPTDQSQKRG